MRRTFNYGDERISFTIIFSPRPANRVRISVMPNGRIQADAPQGTDPRDVVLAVRQRARWIWQQLEAWRSRHAHVLPREYVSGESHFYLGRRHMLKVKVSKEATPGVKMLRGRLEITAADSKAVTVRKLLDEWYRRRAQDVFLRRLASCAQQASWLKALPGVRLLNMKTQWGSCSPGGELILNPALVRAPTASIDYVLCHELCHLKEHNHGVRFYRLLSALVPDWETRKRELDDMAEQLLNR